MSKVKPFFKITFQDIEIAEDFFENEKYLSEFLLAVSYYYRGKDYQIKTKIVQKYFNTYKKTMDFIIASKKTGSQGGLKRIENELVTSETLEGLVEGVVKEVVQPNNKVLSINNEEVNNKINIIPTPAKAENLDFQLLLEYLNKKTNSKFRVVNDKVKAKFRGVLKQGYTKEDIKNAIDNAVKAQHHIDNGFQYLTLEFFSRADKLDMYSKSKNQIESTNTVKRKKL